METPVISIKIKGANAINALTSKGQIVGTMKLEGAAGLAKGGSLKMGAVKAGELEAEGLIATKHGIVKSEVEGLAMQKGAAAKAGSAAKVAGSKGAASGTIWSGKGMSLGLGWGLGSMGPVLVLGALGLGAVGIYLYRRNRKLEEEQMAFEDEAGLPAI